MNYCLILGFFDGVHIAHKELISFAVNFAKSKQLKTVLLTFKHSPASYFTKKTEYIITRKNSISLIKKLGVDSVVEADFSKLVNISAEEYLKNIVENYSPVAIFTGYNHTFGHNKIGNVEFLMQNQKLYNYKAFSLNAKIYENEVISSTLIKYYLKQGNIEKANSLLGYNFYIEGVVIKGNQIGRQIEFPTANIEYPSEIIKLPFGVYSIKVYNKNGILNWGIKPTINGINKPILEAHILDFNKDIYGHNLKIEFVKYIRPEIKFNSIEELKKQIEKDIAAC